MIHLTYIVFSDRLEPPSLGLVFKCDSSVISAKPVQFTKVAHIVGRGIDEAFFWYPIPPPGYASLGCVVTRTDQVPKEDSFCCPRMDLVNQANVSDEPVSRSPSSKAPNCWSIWAVDNQVLKIMFGNSNIHNLFILFYYFNYFYLSEKHLFLQCNCYFFF